MDSKFYSFSSDIWSIGMVVFEMATGRHPYPETSNPFEMHEIMKTMPAPSLSAFGVFSPELVDFTTRW